MQTWLVKFRVLPLYPDPLMPSFEPEEIMGGIKASNGAEAWERFLSEVPSNQRSRYIQTEYPEIQRA